MGNALGRDLTNEEIMAQPQPGGSSSSGGSQQEQVRQEDIYYSASEGFIPPEALKNPNAVIVQYKQYVGGSIQPSDVERAYKFVSSPAGQTQQNIPGLPATAPINKIIQHAESNQYMRIKPRTEELKLIPGTLEQSTSSLQSSFSKFQERQEKKIDYSESFKVIPFLSGESGTQKFTRSFLTYSFPPTVALTLGQAGAEIGEVIYLTGKTARKRPDILFKTGKEYITTSPQIPGETISALKQPEVLGSLLGGLLGGYSISKGVTKARELKIRYTQEKVEPPVPKQVLTGADIFPRTTSPQQTLSMVEKTPEGYKLYHTTQQPFQTKFLSKNIEVKGSQDVAKARQIEDDVLFTSPQASPYFLGLAKDLPKQYKISLFPKIQRPFIAEIYTSKISRIPIREITKEQGFEYLNKEYYPQQVGKGTAFVTKRSELGTGAIPRERRYKGTTEAELGIPASSLLQELKGKKQYVEIEGKPIEKIRFKLVESKAREQEVRGEKIYTGERLDKMLKLSYGKSKTEYYQPVGLSMSYYKQSYKYKTNYYPQSQIYSDTSSQQKYKPNYYTSVTYSSSSSNIYKQSSRLSSSLSKSINYYGGLSNYNSQITRTPRTPRIPPPETPRINLDFGYDYDSGRSIRGGRRITKRIPTFTAFVFPEFAPMGKGTLEKTPLGKSGLAYQGSLGKSYYSRRRGFRL